MQRFICASVGVLTVLLFLASPDLARAGISLPVFSSQMVCDTDGDIDFTDTKGLVTIFDNGDLLINIPGLVPNKDYRIVLGCSIGFPVKIVFGDRSTSSRGRLLAVIQGLGRSGPLATGCHLPTVNIFPLAGGPESCFAGYGQP
jgi:hypothetical protein